LIPAIRAYNIRMMPLALAIGLPIAAWLLYQWLKKAHPQHATKILAGLGAGLLFVFGIFLVMTGKLAGLAAIAAGAWMWVQRAAKAHAVWKTFRGMAGAKPADRREAPPPPARAPGTMSVEEAREILGVGADADAASIKAAHRRLMEANHPDRGGSNWIAARLNQARDRLLP